MTEQHPRSTHEDAPGSLAGRIEAILFVAGEPVAAEELARALDVPLQAVQDCLQQLKDEYDYQQRGFTLRRMGDRVQLSTRPLYARDVVRLLQPIQKQSLSQAAMETLAVVAYRQPITRAEVEQIRGVKCDYSLQSLIGKNLVMEMGRKDAVGRPILYGTTPEFLRHFGIGGLEELPAMPEAGGGKDGDPAAATAEQLVMDTGGVSPDESDAAG